MQTMSNIYDDIQKPLPFFDIMKNINSKLFTIIKKNKELTNYDIKTIHYLKSKGWLNTKTRLTYFKPAEDTQCSICLSKLDDKDPNDIFITPCGHGFCIDCFEQNLSNECPNCSEIINLPFHQETNRYPEIRILRETRPCDFLFLINIYL